MTTASSAEDQGAAAVETVAAPDLQTDANAAAESSPAANQDANEPKSVLEAVIAASKTEAADSSTPKAEAGEKAEGEAAEAEGDKPAGEAADPEAEDAKLPFHKHPRWQEMKADRDRFRVGHESFGKLQGFMAQADLQVDEVNQGFEIMRLIKHEPAKALEALQPYVETLRRLTGADLPADLKAKVDAGQIDGETAAETARLRGRGALSEAEAARAAQAAQQRMVEDIAGAVSEWDKQWASSDPDHAKKQARVLDRIELKIRREGYPASKDAALAIAKAARTEVEKELKGLLPRKPAVDAPPTGQGTVKATAEPTSVLEAIQFAAAQRAA